MNEDGGHTWDQQMPQMDDAAWEEIRGLRRGLICAVALLINILEENGTLDEGIYRESLAKGLSAIETDESMAPVARVLIEFVRTIDYTVDKTRKYQ